MLGSNPIAELIVGDLIDEQRASVREVLDGMVRERAGAAGTAELTAGLNIGYSTVPTVEEPLAL